MAMTLDIRLTEIFEIETNAEDVHVFNNLIIWNYSVTLEGKG